MHNLLAQTNPQVVVDLVQGTRYHKLSFVDWHLTNHALRTMGLYSTWPLKQHRAATPCKPAAPFCLETCRASRTTSQSRAEIALSCQSYSLGFGNARFMYTLAGHETPSMFPRNKRVNCDSRFVNLSNGRIYGAEQIGLLCHKNFLDPPVTFLSYV